MKQTIGLDIAEVSDFRKLLNSKSKSWQQIFSTSELNYALDKTQPEIHLAGCFVAKEAVVKALQAAGFSCSVGDVEIVHATNGSPHVHIRERKIEFDISLTITHTQKIAAATALISF